MFKLWKLERSWDIPGKETTSEVGDEMGWGWSGGEGATGLGRRHN